MIRFLAISWTDDSRHHDRKAAATEDDVILALKDSYVGPVLTKPDEQLEFFLRMIDVLLGEEET